MAPPPELRRRATTAAHQNGRGIELPLQPILGGLPLELQPRLRNADAGDLTISVPARKDPGATLTGLVKITFGELRQAAPDLFTPEDDRDRVLVPLPLGEILARLNPALITRRRVQKQVEVPADICSPFDQRSQGLIFSVGPTKPESAPLRTRRPAPRQSAPPRQRRSRRRPRRDYLRAHAAAAERRRRRQRDPPTAPATAFRSSPAARAEQQPAPAAPAPAAPAPQPRLRPRRRPSPTSDRESAAGQLSPRWPKAGRKRCGRNSCS